MRAVHTKGLTDLRQAARKAARIRVRHRGAAYRFRQGSAEWRDEEANGLLLDEFLDFGFSCEAR